MDIKDNPDLIPPDLRKKKKIDPNKVITISSRFASRIENRNEDASPIDISSIGRAETEQSNHSEDGSSSSGEHKNVHSKNRDLLECVKQDIHTQAQKFLRELSVTVKKKMQSGLPVEVRRKYILKVLLQILQDIVKDTAVQHCNFVAHKLSIDVNMLNVNNLVLPITLHNKLSKFIEEFDRSSVGVEENDLKPLLLDIIKLLAEFVSSAIFNKLRSARENCPPESS